MTGRKKALGIIMVLTAGILWGNTGVFVKILTGRGASAMTVSVLRLVITFILMSLFILIFDRSFFKVNPRCIPYFILTGAVGMVGSSLFYFYSIQQTSMAVAAVLMYTSPTIVMLLSLAVFKDKFTWRHLLCCLLAFFGAALTTGLLSGGAEYSLKGIMFGCLAGASYALYSVGSGLALRKGCSPMTISLYSFAFASVTILIAGDVPELIRTVAADPVILPISAAQALVTCLLPYVIYTLGIRYTGPSNASIMSTIELVVATLIGFFAFDENLSVLGVFGIILVIGSIVVLNLPHRKNNGSLPEDGKNTEE
ncbi:MAG: EamA family transporter [Clostridia bacterium]|nr:EamA family transporter [Clostridia bacterium]